MQIFGKANYNTIMILCALPGFKVHLLGNQISCQLRDMHDAPAKFIFGNY